MPLPIYIYLLTTIYLIIIIIIIIMQEKLSHVPLLIMANKMDLMSALTPSELTAELGLDDIRDRTWQMLPCSAKTGEGLQVIVLLMYSMLYCIL